MQFSTKFPLGAFAATRSATPKRLIVAMESEPARAADKDPGQTKADKRLETALWCRKYAILIPRW